MRPKIICQMVTSIDGRLNPSRWTDLAGVEGKSLHARYDAVYERLGADGWIVGRVTASEMAKGLPRQSKASGPLTRSPFVADRRGRSLGVVMDPGGQVHYGTDMLAGDHVVAVLGEDVSDDYLAELRGDGVSYVFAGSDGHDLSQALDTIGETYGVKLLVLQGGGRINGAFLKAGLIDEFVILMFPAVDGLAAEPSFVEADGDPGDRPAAGLTLELLGVEKLEGDMVFLRYAVRRTRQDAAGRLERT